MYFGSSEKKQMMKILATVALSGFLASAVMADEIEDRYNKTCAICHAAGAAGAPKTGDEKVWAERLEKGMDTLVENVNNGINAMPPKGMCFDCSDEDVIALIEYMAKPR